VSAPVPYTWRIGVDNTFGYLHRRDGAHLAESRRFLGGTGLAVRLTDGTALLTAGDGASRWQPVTAERACELAEIPSPQVDGAAETQRRLDPFHVERHTSPLFLAIVDMAGSRGLPCGHALRAWLAGQWDGTFDGPFLEAPETFAASVIERITEAPGATPQAALLEQVACDSLLDPAAAKQQGLAEQSGWLQAFGELPGLVSHFTQRLAQDRKAQHSADSAGSDQMTLI
jgi:hypothetical protein